MIMPDKPTIIRVWYDGKGIGKVYPWIVSFKGRKIPCACVRFKVPGSTVFAARKQSNPKGWLRFKGRVDLDADLACAQIIP